MSRMPVVCRSPAARVASAAGRGRRCYRRDCQIPRPRARPEVTDSCGVVTLGDHPFGRHPHPADPAPEIEALLLGEPAGLFGEPQGVRRLTSLPVAGGQEGPRIPRLNGWPMVSARSTALQLGEAAVQVAEEQMAPAGEDVGGDPLVGAETVTQCLVASGR